MSTKTGATQLFYQELVITKKYISIFPNNKPWVSKSVKTTIIQRNISFNQRDDTRCRELQKQERESRNPAERW